MKHVDRSDREGSAYRPIRVQAPHGYDGIGQALRSVYRDHRDIPDPIANALRRLDGVD